MKSESNSADEGSSAGTARGKSRQRGISTGRVSPKYQDPRVGTRSVNTLSAAQLERKRANDREAQRIIRQRTKEHIENLERQVAEAGDKEERLNKATQRIAELESQNAELRQRNTEMSLQAEWRQNQPNHQMHTYTDVSTVYTPRSCVSLIPMNGR